MYIYIIYIYIIYIYKLYINLYKFMYKYELMNMS